MQFARSTFIVALCYSAATVTLTYPLVFRLGAAVPMDVGDPLFSTWILWWNSTTAPYTQDWWNAPIFFPLLDSLALSEHLLGLSLFTTPVIWLRGNPQLGYNIAFLLTFFLSGLAGYVLGLTLTRRPAVAFVLGLAYAFAPYRMSQLSHIQTLASFWMPLALTGLHKYVEDRRLHWLALFGVSTLLQGLTNGYYLLFFPVLIVFWLLWFLPPIRQARSFVVSSTVFVIAMFPLVPILMHYRVVHQRLGLRRLFDEVLQYSADVTALVRGSPDLSFWGQLLPATAPEASLFPGLTVVLLVVAGLLYRQGESGPVTSNDVVDNAGIRWMRIIIGLAATLTSLAAASFVVFGQWKVNLLGLTISVSRISKPFSSALLLWLVFALTGSAGRKVLRTRSSFAFYVFATLLMWLLSFGPDPAFLGRKLIYWPPYRWLTWLPGFDGLRVPARFAMLATLCIATAGSLALVRLFHLLGRRGQMQLTALVAVGILIDGWRGMPLVQTPLPSVIRVSAEPGAVLELPLGDVTRDLAAMYRSMDHRHSVVNGYSGYFPAHYAVLQSALATSEADVLDELARRGVRHIVVFDDGDPDGQVRTFVSSYPRALFVRAAEGQSHYRLQPSAPADESTPVVATNIPIIGVRVSPNPDDARRLHDRDKDTFWTTGHAQTGQREEILLDLGVARPITGVHFVTGRVAADYPRDLSIESSTDGITWVVLWRGRTAGLALNGVLDDPINRPLRVNFNRTQARHLRLRQLSSDPFYFWSIAEIAVVDDSTRR